MTDLMLWYGEPAGADWLRALPVGNGRLGAMVFGNPDTEALQLNEDTVWAGGPVDSANPNGAGALPAVQRLIFAERWREAQDLLDDAFLGHPVRQLPYQTVGNLRLVFPESSTWSQYRRELDLTTATATVTYVAGGVRHRREVIASVPDQVIAVRLTAGVPGAVTFTATFDSPQRTQLSSPDGTTVALAGVSGDGPDGILGSVRFLALVRAVADGGEVTSTAGQLSVAGAGAVTLLVSIGTSYVDYTNASGDPVAAAWPHLRAATATSYSELRRRHVADYQRLFGRVTLDLGHTAAAEQPTDVRIARHAGDDPHLATLLFQYGRYLLISSSRPGTQPANLQGIWNDQLDPPWGCRYTININLPMNYWLAGPANLPECFAPLQDLVRQLAASGARTARVQYGAGGWVTHHNTDGWRGSSVADGAIWGMWQTGGAWLAVLAWDHYLFTGDVEALRASYPALRGAAQFFLDTLVPEPEHGWLVTNPSNSPEQEHHPGVSVCAGPTMDMQILRDLFGACVRAGEILGLDPELRDRLRSTRDRLAPTRVGARGNIQEWLHDWVEVEQTHRHVSHLYGLHPSNQITRRGTPELFEAARRTLELRGDAGTGWSLAGKINFWARMEEPERAHDLLRALIVPDRLAPNLFDLHPPFQIDGNFGATAGIAEMLLHSHAGELHLLPALPAAWPDGHVDGLRARGGYTVGATWRDGRATEVRVAADHPGPVRVRSRMFTGPYEVVDATAGGRVAVAAAGADAIELPAEAGHSYRLGVRSGRSGRTPGR